MNKPKILIIELAAHFEVARAYIKMFHAHDFEVNLITNQFCYNLLIDSIGNETKEIIVLNNNSTLSEKLYFINSNDFVICTTPENSSGEVIIKTWSSKSFLVIHDVNNYFDVWNNINWKFNPIQLLRIIKYFASSYFKKRRQALKTFDGFIVPSPIISNYLSNSFNIQSIPLPFLWNEGITSHPNSSFKIVIPGSINTKSRDYILAANVLKEIKPLIHQQIVLVLLGYPKDNKSKKICENFKLLESDKLKVKTYDTIIDQNEFDHQMREASLLLLPLKSNWIYGIVKEIGGKTCISGNLGDMVRYGKKAFIPEDYVLQEELGSFVVRYNQSNLSKKLADYINENEEPKIDLNLYQEYVSNVIKKYFQ